VETLAKDIFHLPELHKIDQMYNWAYIYLTESGYFADYGSVNFSRHDSETGTSEYFEKRLLWGEPYLGLGNYATTLHEGYWLFNNYKVDDYIKNIEQGNSIVEYCYKLPLEELAAKYILFSLNFGKINIDHFHRIFGVSLNSLYDKELIFAENRGWIHIRKPNIYLANDKFTNLYFLRSLFYSNSAKQWFFALCKNGKHYD
jgi:oxygen-independent coproporphyrinogen III oxidase